MITEPHPGKPLLDRRRQGVELREVARAMPIGSRFRPPENVAEQDAVENGRRERMIVLQQAGGRG